MSLPQSDISTVPVKVNFPAPELTLTGYAGHFPFPGGLSWAGGAGQPVGHVVPAVQEGNASPAILLQQSIKEQGFVVIAINDGDPNGRCFTVCKRLPD